MIAGEDFRLHELHPRHAPQELQLLDLVIEPPDLGLFHLGRAEFHRLRREYAELHIDSRERLERLHVGNAVPVAIDRQGRILIPPALRRHAGLQREIQFFGNQYTITRGDISFFNPVRIEPVIDLVDLILVMSVNPGFGGQAFIPFAVEKVARLRALCGTRPIDIEVDGGITPETAPQIAQAGANVLVAGSAVFKGGKPDAYRANIAAIRNAAALARGEAA